MDSIMSLADAYNLKVIEDCAAAVCSSYKGKAVGTFGDMGMWSFDAMKILVCGDGAALHFREEELRERANGCISAWRQRVAMRTALRRSGGNLIFPALDIVRS